jgi:hypothetical protein
MRAETIVQRTRDVAQQLGRLSPDWRNPERYFERREELRRELLILADHMGGGRGQVAV